RRRRQRERRHRLGDRRRRDASPGRRLWQPRRLDHRAATRHHRHRDSCPGSRALARNTIRLMNNGEADAKPTRGWLNLTVLGAGLTSFLADVCYEMASAVLPGFMHVLGLPAFALTGLVEGAADATSNFAKLGAGWYSDRLGRRKPFVLLGYTLTG